MSDPTIKKLKESLLNLPSPEDKDTNKWCDIIEFLCLTNIDKQITKGDIKNYIVQDNIGSNIEENSDEIYENTEGTYNENQILKTDIDFGSEDTLIQDNISQFINDWFDLLKYRQTIYNSFYPFELAEDLSSIKINTDTLTDSQYFYLYLLLSSNLRLVDKSNATKIAADFELFAFNAFDYLLPKTGLTQKYILGKGKHRDVEFKSLSKYHILKKLAALLNTDTHAHVKEENYSKKDTGEAGLDLVGWINFEDNNPGKLIIFGQCACGVEWEDKPFESSEVNWESIINTSVLPAIVNTLFIPRSFMISGGWQKQEKIKKAILFDRNRILKCTILTDELKPYLHINTIKSFFGILN